MNLYVAGAALGATTSAALLAVWAFGSGGDFGDFGAQSQADKVQPMDVQIAPYIARVQYQGGNSALVPISVAFRVDDHSAGKALCRDLPQVQRAVTVFMKQNVGAQFSWQNIASSGLDNLLVGHVNVTIGKDVVRKVFIAPGDRGVGEWPTTCNRMAQTP